MNLLPLTQRLNSPNAARWAAGAALTLVLVLIATPLILGFRVQAQERTHTLRLLAVLQAEAAEALPFRERLKELTTQTANLPGALQAKTAALGQSLLQQTIESLVTANGANVRSAQMLPITKQNGFDVVAVQYDLTVPMSRLGDLTYAVESHTPYLFISDATISGGQDMAGSSVQDPQLEVRWTVRAYRWGAV